MQTLALHLASTGCYVSDEDKVLSICNGLDGDYYSIMETIKEGGAPFQELIDKLLTQEYQIERRNCVMSLL